MPSRSRLQRKPVGLVRILQHVDVKCEGFATWHLRRGPAIGRAIHLGTVTAAGAGVRSCSYRAHFLVVAQILRTSIFA
jgi:hypothetical protein